MGSEVGGEEVAGEVRRQGERSVCGGALEGGSFTDQEEGF